MIMTLPSHSSPLGVSPVLRSSLLRPRSELIFSPSCLDYQSLSFSGLPYSTCDVVAPGGPERVDDEEAPEGVVLPPLVLQEPTTAHHGQGGRSGHTLSDPNRTCGPHNRECAAQALSEALVPWIRVVHRALLTEPKDEDIKGWEHYFDEAQLLAVHRWFSAGPKRVTSPDVVRYCIWEEKASEGGLHGTLEYTWLCPAMNGSHCRWVVTFYLDEYADGTIKVKQAAC